MESVSTKVNSFYQQINVAKPSILDVYEGLAFDLDFSVFLNVKSKIALERDNIKKCLRCNGVLRLQPQFQDPVNRDGNILVLIMSWKLVSEFCKKLRDSDKVF